MNSVVDDCKRVRQEMLIIFFFIALVLLDFRMGKQRIRRWRGLSIPPPHIAQR